MAGARKPDSSLASGSSLKWERGENRLESMCQMRGSSPEDEKKHCPEDRKKKTQSGTEHPSRPETTDL